MHKGFEAEVVRLPIGHYRKSHDFRDVSFEVTGEPMSMSLGRLIVVVGLSVLSIGADEPRQEKQKAKEATPALPPLPAGTVPLNKEETVLVDAKGKRLWLKTQVALREGSLEMLCCIKQTKEHESILSLDAKAYVVHTGLLALGAKSGHPVQFNPQYAAPAGQKIDIFVNWIDDKGKARREPARTWVRHATLRFWTQKMETFPGDLTLPANTDLRYDRKLKELSWYGSMTKAQKERFLALSADKGFRQAIERFFSESQHREMQAEWVFAGSGFYTDEDTGKKFYLAEDGDVICVANFPTAMIDVAVKSSAEAAGLMFEAYTERLPPKGTPVWLELIPVLEEKAKTEAKP